MAALHNFLGVSLVFFMRRRNNWKVSQAVWDGLRVVLPNTIRFYGQESSLVFAKAGETLKSRVRHPI